MHAQFININWALWGTILYNYRLLMRSTDDNVDLVRYWLTDASGLHGPASVNKLNT